MYIRRAIPDESQILSDLAYKSKGYWNYDREYMDLARKELFISSDEIVNGEVFVLVNDRHIIGFYELVERSSEEIELLWLFVEPFAIGGGYGKKLWMHVILTARKSGYKRIRIKSDPNAEGFYIKQGAERVGELPSTIRPDLMFPLLYLNLDLRC